MKIRNAAVLVAIASVVGALMWPDDDTPPRLGVHWRDHAVYRYRLAYEQDHRSALPAVPGASGDAPPMLDVVTELDADVELVWRGRIGERVLMAWRFAELRGASVRVQDTEMLSTQAERQRTLLGHELLFEVDADGRVGTIHVDPDAPELFTNLARMVVAETQVHTVEPAWTWNVTERGALGVADTAYTIDEVSRREIVVNKKRSAFASWTALTWITTPGELEQEVDHDAEVVVSAAGDVTRIGGHERVEVSTADGTPLLAASSELAWELIGIDRAREPSATASERLARRRAYELGEVVDSPLARRNLLEQQIAGLDWNQLRTGVLAFTREMVTTPSHADLAWRAEALLERDPQLCADLAALVLGAEVDVHGRGFALDLLGHVGHAPAQAAMLRVLDDAAVRANVADHARLIQRLALVESPTDGTIEFVATELRRAEDPDSVAATAYTLGAVIARMDQPEQADRADALNTELIEMLAAEPAPMRAVAARALANTRRDANLDVLRRARGDGDASVRLAVTDALMSLDPRAAREDLAGLAGDPDPRVQGRALAGLERIGASEADMAVAEAVAEGRVSAWNYDEAITVLDRVRDDELRRRALERMSRTTIGDPRVRAAIDARLGG